MQSRAKTVEEYIASLPPDRREAVAAIRRVILANLDRGIEEGMYYGMIAYFIPHSVYPPGYHCNPDQPLPFAGLASQKHHLSVYLMSVYADSPEEKWFRQAWARTGRKLDMGKCCVRFRTLENAALDVIGEAIRRAKVPAFIEYYETAIRSMNKTRDRAARGAASDRPATRAAAKRASGGTKKSTKQGAGKSARIAGAKRPAARARNTVSRR
ncbi:MAG: DUF1801 domain-containing protein [Phycisphaerales bacterium]